MRTLPLLLIALAACRGPQDDTSTPIDADGDGVAAGDDCNDEDPTVYLGADERCDGVDNDCDDVVDDEPIDAATFYADADGDGYGDAATGAVSCDPPAGTVSDATDCDDAEAAVHPGAPETDCADPTDYNCDGAVGFADGDGDGFPACEDCDDADAAVKPGAEERCDGVDEDCDGLVDDEATDAGTWYADGDGDGYGAGDAVAACEAPTGHVADATDCDDGAASIFPGAVEACDGIDGDCDGEVDEGAGDAASWYADADGDGYGDAGDAVAACAAPPGRVADATDCDDADASAYPGAAEACDAADDDCDGTVDEGVGTTWYADGDGDGHGDEGTTTVACAQPSGHVAEAGDCDDAEAAVNPDATEVCGGVDDDCDGLVDDDDPDVDAGDQPLRYADADADGYGDPSTGTRTCAAPGGRTEDGTDCDDEDGAVHPGADETWYDGVDQDCDGASDYDQDGDGHDSKTAPSPGDDQDDTDADCWDTCLDGSTPERAAVGCAALEGAEDGMYWLDPDGDGDAYEAWCEMTTDGGGWELVIWLQGAHHTTRTAVKPEALGDMSTHAKLDDAKIREIALAGDGEAMIRNATATYIERYSTAEWEAYDSTGWKNAVYDVKASNGTWSADHCNGHYNNRGFSTYSDRHGAACPVVFKGSASYMVTYHTFLYAGGVGGPFGVFLR